jgi:CMP-N-acetylneuraminic acid synthetase
MSNKVVALLPMKRYSERIPNKNLLKMCGLPLFYHVLNELRKSKSIKSIVINTDSQEIIDCCKQDFPNIICTVRPNAICGDFVEMNEIIKYDISNLNGEHFLQTHSTNPLLSEKTISAAIASYFDNLDEYDSLFSVNKIQTRLFNSNFRPLNHKKGELIRTQDLEPIYEENSNFYIFSKTSFFDADRSRIGNNPYLYEMEKYESIDIDNMDDFILAETIMEKKIL